MLEGSQHNTWNEIWYISNKYKFHLCPRRSLFKRIKYSFKMIGKEETEKKFIFSYGLGSVAVDTDNGEMVIQNVQYTPEVSLNILSLDLLEAQGFMVKTDNTKCQIKNMYQETQVENEKEAWTVKENQAWEQRKAITDHNNYLEGYFESLDPKEENSLIKGLEELSCDGGEAHDYIDDDYLSFNGTLYALKVNSFPRFLSFINLIKKDSIVFRNWEVFSKKYIDMVKWFYLVYLNYDYLEELPPKIGVISLDLLALHKAVDSLGGYVAVTLSDKWNRIAQMQGLTTKDGDTVKGVFQQFVDLVVVYHDTAQVKWTTDKSNFEVGESSWTAKQMDPEDLNGWTVRDEHAQQQANKNGVENKANVADMNAGTSSGTSNDFDVIV